MTPRPFGTLGDGRRVQAVDLASADLSITVLTLGAILQDARLAGLGAPLTLGSEDLADYEGRMGYFGAVVGPVANRIAGARTQIGGRNHDFPPNEGPNLLHGGTSGTHAQIWTIDDVAPGTLALSLDLPDGLGGFPGNRHLTAAFAFDGRRLTLELTATTDAPTLMNLANHSYWRLGGTGHAGHRLAVAADSYLPVDAALIPTGEIRAVHDAFDLRAGRVLDGAEGFDHNFCLARAPRPLTRIAELAGPSAHMLLETTAPGLQVYSGNPAGVALEPQFWPDAPNNPAFPPILLTPGQTFRQTSRWTFTRREGP
jgi:aldose 1-epimerase